MVQFVELEQVWQLESQAWQMFPFKKKPLAQIVQTEGEEQDRQLALQMIHSSLVMLGDVKVTD